MRKLIAFKASWCGPCKMITPFLQQLKEEGYDVEMIDIDENTALAEENNVLHVPTLDFFEDGKKYRRVTGYRTKEDLIAFFTEPA